MRKKIAVLVGQADETTQRRFIAGFTKQAYKYDYDVCIFSMHQKYQETWMRDLGDSNIFELINYDLFEGVVVLLDTILTKDLCEPLQQKIKEQFLGPVLVLDRKTPYFDSIMVDHYTPFKKLVEHLIDVHEYKDIAFLGGKEGHPHSVQRLNAFLDVMKEHNLPVNQAWICHGNYWYDSGEEFVDCLLQDKDHLPRAIACANDIMAIGVATKLTENGIRVPEDVALVGYDSIEDGRCSPKPLTSAPIPADECGEYALHWIHSKITGGEMPEFEMKAPLFIGASCGCDYEIEMVPKRLRPMWRTQQSARSMFSDFNHIMEDLLTQTRMEGFWETVKSYTYQIRPFHTFHICMNSSFLEIEKNIGEKAIRKGYADTMCKVLSCSGTDELKSDISFDRMFATKDLLPEMYEEREYPTTYIFNPIYFDDKCFGYAVLNYGREIKMYDEGYRVWMRDIMQGMEAFYRQQYLQDLVNKIKADQVRDSLTGLYNYDGFIKHTMRLINEKIQDGKKIYICAIDIKGIKSINEIYGREYGDKSISVTARFIQEAVQEGEVCARMCNDEFLIAYPDDVAATRGHQLIATVESQLKEYHFNESTEHFLSIHHAEAMAESLEQETLDAFINYVVSLKNHKKVTLRQNSQASTSQLEAEIKRNQLVDRILNQNQLTYYYQPIVSAVDGSVYAYEALMRCTSEPITPFEIIQGASYLNRLKDVERATLLNVTKDVTNNLSAFGDAKVFVNSLPRQQMEEKDDEQFMDLVKAQKGRFVIEFTEEAELDDQQLKDLKEKYELLGNEIAIDDYGAGYSNINNLLRYMPNYVKIDRQLIAQIHENPQKQHFVRNIIEFSHNNNIKALAEGVETKEELRECIKMGVDLIQGFYTARPSRVPVREISEKVCNEIRWYHRVGERWYK